ncbi:MCE family protein [Mycolicibacterium pulveris]|uniref:Mce/MlaD domain-containing protein n=1 Tax=Mycolicibacterium pulveris TaxID=36813 RepID=A0A7I7UPL9_MYCPV|nr:MCE family protein [Mycolicibacterium pulveris]BBY83424.1 hypothetical protein MPUL_45820 [Mycolicibacterium pulveris]
MRTRALLSFAVLAAIIAFALNYFGSLGVHFRAPAERVGLSLNVPDINGLVVGSSVLLRGVPIGSITNITTDVDYATVHFYIDDRFKIPVDSELRLESLSALGEAYLAIAPRSDAGPFLKDGQHIPAEEVTSRPSVSELVDSVVRVLSQLDPTALERIINEADEAMPNPVETLPNLERASMLLRNTATHLDGKGEVLLGNFQTLLRNAEFVGPILADLAPSIRQMGVDVAGLWRSVNELVRRGSPTTLHNFANYLLRIERFLDHRSGDIKVLTQSMLPYLNDIAGALMNLDTGQLLDNVLKSVPEDGVVTLRVSVPDR